MAHPAPRPTLGRCPMVLAALVIAGCAAAPHTGEPGAGPTLSGLDEAGVTANDSALLLALGRLDVALRTRDAIEAEQTAVGLMDLRTGRFAMLRPDTTLYAASVPKIAILLAYFETRPGAAEHLDDDTRRELGLMIKRSDNAMAAKHSRALGLDTIADALALPRYRLYDPLAGGGLWIGKHYGPSDQRLPDPLTGEVHAATVRQLVRYYHMLETGRLVSPAASAAMRSVFESPGLDHLASKFMLGLAGRGVSVIRKSGTWRSWHADTAVVTGPGRHYALVALTHHERGAEYLADLARSVDVWAEAGFAGEPGVVATPSADAP